MNTVHDNEILSYLVDLKNERIMFHTQHRNSTIIKNIDILFTDVLAHYFEDELHGSIILDIYSYDIDSFIADNTELLINGKDNSWPMNYSTLAELTIKLTKEQYHYYAITASYGLSGWVLSKHYETKESQ